MLECYYSHGILATCIQSVVRVGLSLVICEVSFRSPRGAERSKREKPCRSSIDSIAKGTYWPRFLPMPMKRDTTLGTELRWTSGFIAIKTVPGLHLGVNEKGRRRYTQQATKKRSVKHSCHVFHKHFQGTNYEIGSFSIHFLTLESYVQLL